MQGRETFCKQAHEEGAGEKEGGVQSCFMARASYAITDQGEHLHLHISGPSQALSHILALVLAQAPCHWLLS